MHNLGTVFRFEVRRTLKKKSFWIMALLFPVLIAAIGAIVFFSNKATSDAADKAKDQRFSLEVTDESGLVDPKLVTAFKATTITDKQQGIRDVESGKTDAYFFYPKDVASTRVEVYGKDIGLFDNGRYSAVASALLSESVGAKVTSAEKAVLAGSVNVDTTTYRDGKPYNGFAQMIAPGLFLILFYALIAFFGGQMLSSTIEEKENRVIEMILTTVQARVLIIGKILSLIVLAFIQIAIILIPVIMLYLLFHDQLSLPSFDLSSLPLDPARIATGAIIFILSFLLFTGLLVGIGAAMPTAKEASGFFGIVMMLIFGPLYAVTLFISAPTSGVVVFLSFFPLTAPIPLMLRNAVGNLSYHDAAIAIVILAISAVIVMAIAIRIFRYGVLEYSSRVSLATIFARPKAKQQK